MINVGPKEATLRRASAHAIVSLSKKTLAAIQNGTVPKGDVLAVAKVAAIQAAKETSRILPLCHPLPLECLDVEFQIREVPSEIEIRTSAEVTWKTGVEMEALTAAAAAALTIYDMCKSLDRGMSIHRIELLEKSGGRSGSWKRIK